MLRELLWAVLNVAAGIVVAAAAILYSQELGAWRVLLWIGVVVFLTSAIALIVHSIITHKRRQPQAIVDVEVLFKSIPPYETSEISHGRILSTVRIGLKALGKPLSNCKLYIEKTAPDPGIPGGLPILLEGGDFILWPDDPEKLYDIASHWDHVAKFRFNSQGGWWAETMNYIDDAPSRGIEIKFVSTEITKTFLFKLWTDESKKLHLEQM
jgi:hypothetical protein